MLGKSLADGTGYRLMYLVGAPVAVKFPPRSLPALLAIPCALGGTLAAVRATVGILNPRNMESFNVSPRVGVDLASSG